MEKRTVFWLVFTVILIFLGYKFIPVYSKYFFLKQEINRVLKRDDLKDRASVIEKVTAISVDMNMDLTANNISIIESVAGDLYLEIKYERNIDLLVYIYNQKLFIRKRLEKIN